MNGSFPRMFVGMLAAGALVTALGCGGGQKTESGPAAAPTQTTEAQAEQNALPLSRAAPVPSTLHCTGEIVWVNLNRKTYHESGDPYYGTTKHGEYMCKAAADAAGYHLAGTAHMTHHRGAAGMPSSQTQTPVPYPT